MDNMTAGEFVAFITAASLMAKPVRQLTEINSEIQKGLAAAAELFGLLEVPAERDEGHHEPGRLVGRVRFEGVRFRYGEGQPEVLKGIDLEVAPGEIHWVSAEHGVPMEVRLYDNLFTVEQPDRDKDADFLDHLNPESQAQSRWPRCSARPR